MQVETMPWEVVSVEETTVFQQNRGPVPSLRINFKMADGTHSYVLQDKKDADPATIHDEIHKAATLLTQILQLEHGPVGVDSSGQPYMYPGTG